MTGLVHESPVSSLVLPVLMRPILSGLERQDQGASQTLRAAFSKVPHVHCIADVHLKISVSPFDFLHFPQVEYAHPGFTYDLVMRLVTSIVTLPETQHYIKFLFTLHLR